MTLCISLSARPSNNGTRFHNHLYEALGLNWIYKAFAPTDLAQAIAGVRGLGIRGCAISMPYKEDVIALVDRMDPSATAIDSVRELPRSAARVTLNIHEHEDCITLELWHSGRPGRPSSNTEARAPGLARLSIGDFGSIRQQVQAAGGDMLLDVGADGTTYRLFLPVAVGEELADLPVEGMPHFSETVAS